MSNERSPKILWTRVTDGPVYEDCACSTTAISPRINIERPTSLWEKSPNLYHEPLSQEFTLTFNPFVSTGIAALNPPAESILESYRTPQALTNDTARQLAAIGLLQPQGSVHAPPQVKPNVLTAWLHVTNQCNLRCTYCYLHKNKETMDENTGRAAVETILRSAVKHKLKGVKLKYAGGEAVLNFRLIRILHQHAQSLAKQSGLELQEVILSNGVALGRKFLDFIRDQNIGLMISLDGIGSVHNRQRVFANGRGSFELVEKGIDRAISHGVHPHLSITITGHNVEGVADTVAFALDRDLSFNLNFYRDNDYSKDKSQFQAEDKQLIAAMRAAFAIIEERLPQRSLINALVDRSNFGGSHIHTCGAGRDYLVVDHKGRIARCQMEIERTVTDIFASDPLTDVQNFQRGFQNISVDEKEQCCNCKWRYWCAGGCPLLTYRTCGRNDVKSPYCNVYKTLYPKLLRLEGLRLLKWHATSGQPH